MYSIFDDMIPIINALVNINEKIKEEKQEKSTKLDVPGVIDLEVTQDENGNYIAEASQKD